MAVQHASTDLIPFEPRPLSAEELEDARHRREVALWEKFSGDIVTPEQLDPWFAYSDLPAVGETEKAAMVTQNEPFVIVGLNGPFTSDKYGQGDRQYMMMACALPRMKSMLIINVNYSGSNQKALDRVRHVVAAGKKSGPWVLHAIPTGKGNDFIALGPYRPGKGQPQISELKI